MALPALPFGPRLTLDAGAGWDGRQ